MRKILTLVLGGLLLSGSLLRAEELSFFPSRFQWTGDRELYLSDGRQAARLTAVPGRWKVVPGDLIKPRYDSFPVQPEGAVNLTYSPDSTRLAFTRDNDLYVVDIASGKESRLTTDGSPVILNGYASWVYYEEIFGRPSRYRAFWWSPDSRRLAYYRFDDSRVPMFPIYSPFGQDGTLRETHYPKAGERNPEVRIGFVDVDEVMGGAPARTVWADFDPSEDQYFGTPFWSDDSRSLFVPREPRIQNMLDLYAVSCEDGSRRSIYHETYPTWLDWIEGMLFDQDGLYMVRSFETGWEQIYFLSYDGKTLRRLTDGPNWKSTLVGLGKDGSVYFTAQRDSRVRKAFYKVDRDGKVTALTDPDLNVGSVALSPDGKFFAASLSSLDTPTQVWVYQTDKAVRARSEKRFAKFGYRCAALDAPLEMVPELVTIVSDGLELPATITYPAGFDPSRKYPVHVDLYGGPDSPLVSDTWAPRYGRDRWFYENGIIQVVADCRAAGHNGREGLDQIYKHLNDLEVKDFVAWANYLKSLPYVKADKIGVEGFSFGGTMTTMLLCTAPDAYHYGIAGGGVYDWALYDTHYTERFMSTPQDNPEGYARSRVLVHAERYPVKAGESDGSVMLKITHGTGDDNVHFQNTLQLIDVLQNGGKEFDFMIYPDGMHGYRGYQGAHFRAENQAFWKKYLLSD